MLDDDRILGIVEKTLDAISRAEAALYDYDMYAQHLYWCEERNAANPIKNPQPCNCGLAALRKRVIG